MGGGVLFRRSSRVLPTPTTAAPAGSRSSTLSSGASGADSTRMRALAPWLLPVAIAPLCGEQAPHAGVPLTVLYRGEGTAGMGDLPGWLTCSGAVL